MYFLAAICILAVLFLIGHYTDLLIREHTNTRHPWRWVTHICTKWKELEDYVHHHRRPFHRAHGLVHASYFAMVFTHGPYNLAAGLLLGIAIIGWLLHLEDT